MDSEARKGLPTRVLGKTAVRLPILGFGTAPAGTRLKRADAIRLYEEALLAGVTYFDTAPEFAGYGKAQEQLGYVLRQRRKDVFLVTKCFEPRGDSALRLLERSLKELQTDYADLVFVHSLGADKMDPSLVFGPAGVYQALIKAKARGLTRFVGISGHNRPGRFLEAIARVEVDVLLSAINFVDQHTYAFEHQVWPVAAKTNIGLLAMKVYGGQRRGLFAGLSNSRMPASYLDLSFRYVLSQPNVAAAAIGMATSKELHENLQRAKQFVPLERKEVLQLTRVGKELARSWGPHLGAVT